ncbi:MAG: PucR family transcriptional regulator [Clostridiaceae bacterium]|nr:PucR family transcriptional regulator [Clostridiaceae bacterium]
MDVSKILTIPSLSFARVIAGNDGLPRSVTGIMVLEAVDIENWGNEGEIILTSYFALKDLSTDEITQFMCKLTSIGISALIVKLDRFVSDIPVTVTDYCNLHALPLIQIPKEVKYESVILEILGPIIDSNIAMLNRHYDVHNKLTRMALKEPSLLQLLEELKKMIGCDVTLINHTHHQQISTNPVLDDFAVIKIHPITATRYMNFSYKHLHVEYSAESSKDRNRAISVDVPNLDHARYELVIHNRGKVIGNDDFMVIENVVSFLQMELLKQYSISQNRFHRNNNLVSDLLNGRNFDSAHSEDLLNALHIDLHPSYQVIMIRLTSKDPKFISDPDWANSIFYGLKTQYKNRWMNVAYLEKQNRITFLYNFSRKAGPILPGTAQEIVETVRSSPGIPDFNYQISLSSTSDRNGIPKINQEAVDIQKILHLFYRQDSALSYDDLGIYKLFMSTGNLEHPERFIPPSLLQFRKDHPELMETLSCFLETNQSFSETAASMYLHPKTIRYRINKIIQILGFNFSDPEQILQAQIASRLFKLMG